MKKYAILSLIVVVLIICFTATGCNKQIIDTTYSFNYAYVEWPDGSSEKLTIKSWKDYDSDQIQIKTTSGNTYVFHASKCVLAAE